HLRLQGHGNRSSGSDSYLGAVQAKHLAVGCRRRQNRAETDELTYRQKDCLHGSPPCLRAIARACVCAGSADVRDSGSGARGAAPAADLGPEVALTEPSGGYLGKLRVTPEHGPAGTPLTVTGEGFPVGQQLELVWRTVKGHWKVTIAEYHGREFVPVAYRIAS